MAGEQSALTEEALALIGFSSPVATMPEVRAEDIVRYCVAVDDVAPLYADAERTLPVAPEDLVAPADFCQCYRFGDVPLDELAPDGLPLLRDGVPRLPVPLQRVVFGGAEMEFHDRVRVGDRIEVQTTIADVYERVGRSGPAVFAVLETTCRRGSGELVTVMRMTSVYR